MKEGKTRCSAITDIIESVALEQTGLASILEAESDKIQAVVTNGGTNEEILAINDSVESMVNAITRLEIILQSKLSLFKECLCTECVSEEPTNG